MIVLGVGHGGAENLLHVDRDGALAEMQDVESLLNRLATDEIDHEASLVRRDAHELGDGADLAGLGIGSFSCHLRETPYLAL